jgi:hypothetical protein
VSVFPAATAHGSGGAVQALGGAQPGEGCGELGQVRHRQRSPGRWRFVLVGESFLRTAKTFDAALSRRELTADGLNRPRGSLWVFAARRL